MRWTSFLVAAASVIGCYSFISQAAACYLNKVDIGDAPPNATTRCVVPLTKTNNEILSPGDSDWYKITVQKGKNYYLFTYRPNFYEADTVLTLRDQKGKVLKTNDNVTAMTGYSAIKFTAAANTTYFAQVTGIGFNYGIGFTTYPPNLCTGQTPLKRYPVVFRQSVAFGQQVVYCTALSKGQYMRFSLGRDNLSATPGNPAYDIYSSAGVKLQGGVPQGALSYFQAGFNDAFYLVVRPYFGGAGNYVLIRTE